MLELVFARGGVCLKGLCLNPPQQIRYEGLAWFHGLPILRQMLKCFGTFFV